MANTPDRAAEKQLQGQIAAAKEMMTGHPRAKLMFSRLPEKPEGLNGTDRAFEHNKYGMLRMVFQFRGIWGEVMPINVTAKQRGEVEVALGFEPKGYRKITVNSPQAYLRSREYFVKEK